MRGSIHAVGVDLGGTSLRVCAVDGRGRVLRREKRPAPPLDGLSGTLVRLWKTWGLLEVPVLVVGSKGVWNEAPRKAMAASLRGLAKRVVVLSDVELTYRGLMKEGGGFLILAGTGSIALGKDGRGRWVRAGGLGPKDSDEGSGFWIGREYLRRNGLRVPPLTPENVRKTAALTAIVFKRAGRDAMCAGILRDAQGALAGLLQSLMAKTAKGRAVRVGWSGSVLQDLFFREGFFRRLRAGLPGRRIVAVAPRVSAAQAAALLGLWREERSSAILPEG